MRKAITGRATRLWLALTAAGAMMAAVVLGIASDFHSSQGSDDGPSFSSSQSVEDQSFVAIKWRSDPQLPSLPERAGSQGSTQTGR